MPRCCPSLHHFPSLIIVVQQQNRIGERTYPYSSCPVRCKLNGNISGESLHLTRRSTEKLEALPKACFLSYLHSLCNIHPLGCWYLRLLRQQLLLPFRSCNTVNSYQPVPMPCFTLLKLNISLPRCIWILNILPPNQTLTIS